MRENLDAGVSFLELECDTCELYIRLALDADGGAKARRTGNARKAYDAVVHFLPQLRLSPGHQGIFERRLELLGAELDQLEATIPALKPPLPPTSE